MVMKIEIPDLGCYKEKIGKRLAPGNGMAKGIDVTAIPYLWSIFFPFSFVATANVGEAQDSNRRL